jgi:hypothetical protein
MGREKEIRIRKKKELRFIKEYYGLFNAKKRLLSLHGMSCCYTKMTMEKQGQSVTPMFITRAQHHV